MLETDGEHDTALADELVRVGRGRLMEVATQTDVPEAINRLPSYTTTESPSGQRPR